MPKNKGMKAGELEVVVIGKNKGRSTLTEEQIKQLKEMQEEERIKKESGDPLCKHCGEVLIHIGSQWHGIELCDLDCVREYIDDLENGRV